MYPILSMSTTSVIALAAGLLFLLIVTIRISQTSQKRKKVQRELDAKMQELQKELEEAKKNRS